MALLIWPCNWSVGPEVIRTKGELKCCQRFTVVERMNT